MHNDLERLRLRACVVLRHVCTLFIFFCFAIHVCPSPRPLAPSQQESILRDIATIVSEKCVNPTTGRAYTVRLRACVLMSVSLQLNARLFHFF